MAEFSQERMHNRGMNDNFNGLKGGKFYHWKILYPAHISCGNEGKAKAFSYKGKVR